MLMVTSISWKLIRQTDFGAAVLKTGKDTDAYNETTYSLQFLNSAGETVVANVDDDYENDYAKVIAIQQVQLRLQLS